MLGLVFGLLLAVVVPAALAQAYSPYFKISGREHYDRYNDTVHCSAVLELAVQDAQDRALRARLKSAASRAVAAALTQLSSGAVSDNSGAVLAPANLRIDRRNARSDWQVVKSSMAEDGDTPEAEMKRCMGRFAAP